MRRPKVGKVLFAVAAALLILKAASTLVSDVDPALPVATEAQPPAPPPEQSPQVMQLLFRRAARALVIAAVMALGEAAVGLVPIATPFVVEAFSRPAVAWEVCDANKEKCQPAPRFHYDEANIVTVVVSGLAILSLIKLGPKGRSTSLTPVTYLAAISQLGLMIFSSILYALDSAGIAAGNAKVTWEMLFLAVLVAFYMALEEGWLEALAEP